MKNILAGLLIWFVLLISPSFAQLIQSQSVAAYKSQLQQLQSQINQAAASGNQQEVAQLKSQFDTLVIQRMKQMAAIHPEPQSQQSPWGRFAQIKANKQAWLQAHPTQASKLARDKQFIQSQLPQFYALAAARHSGNTQQAAQIRAQIAAARAQYLQTGQIP